MISLSLSQSKKCERTSYTPCMAALGSSMTALEYEQQVEQRDEEETVSLLGGTKKCGLQKQSSKDKRAFMLPLGLGLGLGDLVVLVAFTAAAFLVIFMDNSVMCTTHRI
jgi:hypothetical protein